MKAKEALHEISTMVFRNTDNFEMRISKDCYKNIVNALEKQIPKHYELWNNQCSCPSCNKLFGSYDQLNTLIHWEMPYCKFCGQALIWKDHPTEKGDEQK